MAEKCLESLVSLADVVEIDGVQVFKNLSRHSIDRSYIIINDLGGQTS
jgi:hypothetical protein